MCNGKYVGKDTNGFKDWFPSQKCDQNFSGASGSMEKEAAGIVWKRLLSKGFRYTTILSDSDVKKLKRCLCGATQNANERLNAKIWTKCLKIVNIGYQWILSGVYRSSHIRI